MLTLTQFTRIFAPPYVMAVWLLALLLSGGPAWAQSSIPAPIRVPLGAAARYGLLSGGSLQSATPTSIAGSIGAAQSVAATLTATDTLFANGTGTVSQALAHVQAARNACSALSGTTSLNALNGQRLAGGVYFLNGNAVLLDSAPLILTGNANSVYVFNITGDFTIGAMAAIGLGQVLPGNIYWNVGGNFQAAATASLPGILLVGGAASFAGTFYGMHAALVAGSVQLAAYDAMSGGQYWVSPAYLSSQQVGQPLIVAAPIVCTNGGNMICNANFETGTCLAAGFDFDGYPVAQGGTVARVANCWISYSSPDWLSVPGCTTQRGSIADNDANRINPRLSMPPLTNIVLPARSGNSYAGLYSIDAAQSGFRPRRDEREYLMQELAQPLVQGRAYFAEYYASLAPSSRQVLNQLQIAFVPALPPRTSSPGVGQPLSAITNATVVVSQPNLPNGLNLTWTPVRGTFTPTTANYRVMMLGNFVQGDVVGQGPAPADGRPDTYDAAVAVLGAYYYIEDVSLVPFPGAVPSATIACGSSFLLQPKLSDCLLPPTASASYQWSVNGVPIASQPTYTVRPTATTTYTFTVTSLGQTYSTTTTITVVPGALPGPQTVDCDTPTTLPTCGILPAGASVSWTCDLNDPSLTANATALNPVVTPPANQSPGSAITYTYTLQVYYNGQFYSSGVTTVTVLPCPPPPQCRHPYKENPASTYQNPVTGSKTEIGNRGGVTQLFGNTVFDGIYNIVGPLELTDGEFDVRPGTVFYVDGGSQFTDHRLNCYQRELRGYLRILVGRRATLTVNGARFTSTCNEMWGGIEVVDNGRLVTKKYFSGNPKQRSNISHAIVAVMAGCDINNVEGTYYLTGTDFQNDTYGVAVLGNQRPMTHDECQVSDCRFNSDVAARLFPDSNEYTHAGLVVRGDYHKDIPYKGNTFTSLLVGADVGGNLTTLDQNQFSNCYQTGIRVGGPDVRNYLDYLYVAYNIIDVPDNPAPGGQVPTGTGVEVKGIEQLDCAGGGTLIIEGNEISSSGSINPAKLKIGLDAYLRFETTTVSTVNSFTGFDHGVRLFDAAGTNQQQAVTDNLLRKDVRGVTLTGGMFAPFSPTISCNNIEDNDYGIFIDNLADVGDLGSARETCGNWFYNPRVASVENNGANLINYFAQDSPSENVPFTIPGSRGGTRRGFTGNTCSDRVANYGLRPSAGNSITVQDVQDWQGQLLQNTLAPKVLRNFEYFLTDYYLGAGQLADLETFTNQLPYQNDAAFERLSIYLMETYRRNGDTTGAQRVRQELGSKRGNVQDIAHRVTYFDLAGRLRRLNAGALPSPADSTLLVDLANAGPAYAPIACAALRYYYPQLLCGKQVASGQSVARPAKAAPAASSVAEKLAVRAYPNPATEALTFAIDGPLPAHATIELVALATGNVVRQAPATVKVSISLAGLAPGVYAGRILSESQLLGVCKVVIVR